MPALDYDYDYYEYINGRRVGNTVTQPRINTTRTNTAKKVQTSSKSATIRRSATTVQKKQLASNVAKKTQVRTNKNVTVKRNVAAKSKSTVANSKKKTSIDIDIKASKKIAQKPKEMTLKKPEISSKSKANFGVALKNLALVSIFFFLFFSVCYRYSTINEEFNGIKKLKNELVTIQATNEQLQADIEGKTDLTYVENYAKYQLGMQKPTSSQIQYVKVDKQDKITTPVTIDEVKELNWFENIINEIRKIVD